MWAGALEQEPEEGPQVSGSLQQEEAGPRWWDKAPRDTLALAQGKSGK